VRETRESERRRKRLVEVARSLPDAVVEKAGADHLAFKVRKKIFGYYTFDHHGDGRIALWCKVGGEQGRMVDESPERFFVPPYVGPRGWVGLRLDLPRVSWPEVAYLLRGSYRLTAPRTLAARLE
jgi:phosphoribosylglycinamide formyltransferase-1